MKNCPTCGRPFPPKFAVTGAVRTRMVDLIAARPEGITSIALIAAIYCTDPNGGPKSHNIIAVMVHQANEQLRPQGYEIRASWLGRGALWQLKEIKHANAKRQPARHNNAARVEGPQ